MLLRNIYPKLFIFCACLFASYAESHASHAMGADLQYECLGSNQYRVTLRFYRDCGGIDAPSSAAITISAPGCAGTFSANLSMNTAVNCPPGSTLGCEASQLCPAQIGQSECNFTPVSQAPYPGVRVYVYSGIITLPSQCPNWMVQFSENARNPSTNLTTTSDLAVQALINNTNNPNTGTSYCNNSVSFTGLPVPFVCINSPVTYNHSGVDADGDSLVYTLINPLGSGYTPLTYSSGYSASNPIRTSPPNSFQFNTATGQMNFTPGFQEVDVLAVRVDEYRNGVLVGSTIRDIQVTVLNCAISVPDQDPITNVQNGNQVDSLNVQVCPGTPLQFDILCTDPANHNLTITSNINTIPSAIPGATMTQVGTGDTVTARINWTPLASDTGCHNFLITARNNDCPINGVYNRVYTICVFTQVQVLSASPTFCGTPVQLTATGGTNFTWTPSTGPNAVSNPTVYNPTVSPTSNTMYYFSSDCGVDSVLVGYAPTFLYDAGTGGTICQNGQLQLNASTDSLYAPYHFNWVPPTGLIDPISGLPNDTVPNPVASPLSTTTYVLSVTGTNGCVNRDSLTVTVGGTGPNIVAKAQPTAICPGDPVNLNIITNPQSCGLNQTGCQGNYVQAQLGTATSVTPTGSATGYPTVYGHYNSSSRHQFLYRSSELLSLIGSGGTIDSISFYMDDVTGARDTLRNFEIKMACTQATALTNWQPNLVTVFTPKSVPLGIADGWVTHRLDFPYDWDGTSNLVIDICSNTSPDGILNKKMQMTPTSFNSVYYSKGNTSQCGNTGTPLTSVNRPNTRFNVCVTDVAGLPIAWTPASGPNAPTPTDIVNPVAHPVTPEIYRVDVTAANGCHSNDFIYVNVDTSTRFYAFPDDTFFCSPTSLNLSSTTFGTPLPGNSFSYQFRNLNTNTVEYSGSQNNFTISPIASVDYLVTLTGAACTLRDTIHVVIGNNIPITLVVDSIDCFGQANGKIVAIPGGGTPPINFVWNSGPTIDSIQNLIPGTYSVTVSDPVGCTGSASIALNEPTQLSVSPSSQNVTCNGDGNGIVSLTASGGTPTYTYLWSPPQASTSSVADSLGGGVYTTTITDANGCSVTTSSTVTEPTSLATNVVSYNAVTFGGNEGWAFVVASGGTPAYTYNWDNGSTNDTIQNLYAGTYYVTVCDANGCCNLDTAVITDPPPIILSFSTTDNLCFGDCNGRASVIATGGISPYVFVWSNTISGDSIIGLCNGVYSVTATDSAGFSVSGNVNITSPAQLIVDLDTVDITCFSANDGSVTASGRDGVPPYSYQWTPGGNSNALVTLGPGTYTVVVTDANNCTAQNSWTAIEPPELFVTVPTVTNVSCFGGSNGGATASATGGTPVYTYGWSAAGNSSLVATGFTAGNQSVTVTDTRYCTATTSFVITEPTQLTISVSSTTNVTCNGGTDGAISIAEGGGTPPYYYLWSNTSFTQNLAGIGANNYSVVITDAENCTASASAVVTEPTAVTLSFNHIDPLCTGDVSGSATVVPSGGTPGYTYNWAFTPSANDINSLNSIGAGVYYVVVTDAANCSVQGSVTLTNPPSLNAALINKQEISCANAQDGSVEVSVNGGTPPISFIWNMGSTNSVIDDLAPGSYSVTVADNNGCDTVLNTLFVAPPLISIALLDADSASCPEYEDGSVQISGSGGTPGNSFAYEYSIDGTNFQTSEFFTGLGAGIYFVTIRDSRGCTKDTTVFIGEPVKPQLTILPQDSAIGLGESITLVSDLTVYSAGNINYYSWSPITGLDCADCPSVKAIPYFYTQYTLTVNYISDCSISQTVTVLVGNGEDFFIPTAFSPNGDGNNDVFSVYGSGLAKVNMKIFNRWGEKIFESQNQWAGWDGTYKGAMQNPGVYTYSIEGVYLNGKTKERGGSVTLIR